MKPVEGRGIVTRKIGGFWITWNANLHSIGELNLQNSAAGETRQESYNRFLNKFLFGRRENPIKRGKEMHGAHAGKKRRRKNPIDEPLEFYRDHGVSERYLQDKRRYAEEQGYRTTWALTKVPKWFGPSTASLNRAALFPVAMLEGVPGMEGEEAFDRTESLEYLIPLMKETNQLPTYKSFSGEIKQSAPFINVWANGKWYVNEGNHRIKVARLLGWQYIPLEIRWYSGGDVQSHKRGYTPEQVVFYDRMAHNEGYSVNDFRGIL